MEGNNSNSSSINVNNDDNIVPSLGSSEENPRVKLLCSFGGSILPRPQDGKLRYVGGEMRIVCVPRDVCYEELMSRMRDLFDGAAMILKYQQPDEDLEALVSVLNDDDVVNMMEYDKLGSGDGFTRLRIFMFSHPEQGFSSHYMDGDERNSERQYVDALNILNESPVMTPVDEGQIGDQFFNLTNLEGSGHSQRNYEMGMLRYNLRQLAIPSMGSVQNSAPFPHRYNDENPFSPAYFSPGCGTRVFSVPSSPSSVHFRMPFQEMPDKFLDRMSDEINHPQVDSLIRPDELRQYSDKVLWLPSGGLPVDRGGFPGNVINAPHVSDGTSVAEHCKMTFHDFPEEKSHVEQLAMRNGFPQVVRQCSEYPPNRESVLLNTDSRLIHGDRPLYNDSQTTERGWIVPNQLTQNDESRAHVPGIGRMGNLYTLEGSGAAVPVSGSNLPEGSCVPTTTCSRIEDARHVRAAAEWGADIYHGQAVAAGSHLHTPSEERSVHTANMPFYYGPDVPHQVLHGHPSAQAMWRNAPTSVQVPPPYESSKVQPRIDIPSGVVPRDSVEGNAQFFIGADPSPWAESLHGRLVVDRSLAPEHPYNQISKLNHVAPFQEIQPTIAQDPVRNQHTVLDIPSLAPESLRPLQLPSIIVPSSSARGYSLMPREDTDAKLDERGIRGEASESTHLRKVEHSDLEGIHPLFQDFNTNKSGALTALNPIDSKSIRSVNGFNDVTELGETNTCPPEENSNVTHLSELTASTKKANLESAEVVKARSQEDGDTRVLQCKSSKISETDETESPDVNGNSEGKSQDENSDSVKIGRTKAEEEAIALGLQTIRNDDLEEVRELGSGTYGAVYHGKWRVLMWE